METIRDYGDISIGDAISIRDMLESDTFAKYIALLSLEVDGEILSMFDREDLDEKTIKDLLVFNEGKKLLMRNTKTIGEQMSVIINPNPKEEDMEDV